MTMSDEKTKQKAMEAVADIHGIQESFLIIPCDLCVWYDESYFSE